MKTADAIKEFGSVRELAHALGISVQAVYGWGEDVPRLRAYEIRDLVAQRESQKGAESVSPDAAAAMQPPPESDRQDDGLGDGQRDAAPATPVQLVL